MLHVPSIRNTSHGTPRRITSLIYFCLFATALITVTASYFVNFFIRYKDKAQLKDPVGLFAAIVFALFTFILMLAVYLDLKHIEEKPSEAEGDYPNWINNKYEWWLRLFIMVGLLLGSGKFSDVFSHVKEMFKRESLPFQIDDGSIWDLVYKLFGYISDKLFPNSVSSVKILAISSVVIWFLLFVWNLCALVFRWQNQSTIPFDISDVNSRKVHVNNTLTNSRIASFTVMYLLSSVYWFFVAVTDDVPTWYSTIFMLIYILLTIYGVGMRFKWFYTGASSVFCRVSYRCTLPRD